MKTGAFNKKIIYNHLLAVALAGIVSLLFVQRVCQFLNTSSKRSDYSATTTIGYGEDQKSLTCYYGGADCASHYENEDFGMLVSILSCRLQPYRFNRPFSISTQDQYIFFEKNGYFSAIYRSGLPSMWGPSIPIAHRRLII